MHFLLTNWQLRPSVSKKKILKIRQQLTKLARQKRKLRTHFPKASLPALTSKLTFEIINEPLHVVNVILNEDRQVLMYQSLDQSML